MKTLCLTAALGVAVFAGASSSVHAQNYDGIYDPLESTNRSIFEFNRGVDAAVINPVLKGYRTVVPSPARTGLRNFMRNLKTPTRFANQLLQGDLEGAGTELTRGIINTLIGVGGIFDVAGYEGIEHEPEDFGQTLAVWGVSHGPYMVVPFLGPGSMRDLVGYAVDSYADPLRMYLYNTEQYGWMYARAGTDYLVLRDSLMDVLKSLENSSIDYYAAVRSTYYQRREAMVRDRGDGLNDANAFPDFE